MIRFARFSLGQYSTAPFLNPPSLPSLRAWAHAKRSSFEKVRLAHQRLIALIISFPPFLVGSLRNLGTEASHTLQLIKSGPDRVEQSTLTARQSPQWDSNPKRACASFPLDAEGTRLRKLHSRYTGILPGERDTVCFCRFRKRCEWHIASSRNRTSSLCN